MIRSRPAQRSFYAEREKRLLNQRRHDKKFLFLGALAVVMLLLAIEMGRAYFAMREVSEFSSTIEQLPPPEVKRKVDQFFGRLSDRNPLVRNAAMSGMKLATGWRCGTNPAEWRNRWAEWGAAWEYRKPTAHVSPTAAPPPWADMIPRELLQTSPPPASVP